ncbi:MAG: putative metal-binding motif-containing protein [Myxococcaceae bacterium]
MLAALCGCGGSSKQAALKVELTLGDGAVSKCVQLVIRTDAGSETRSTPVDFNGRKSVTVGVLQGALPGNVTLYAIGYSDLTCMTPTNPVERADETKAEFAIGKVEPVSLSLSVRADAKDDDGDGYLSAMTGGDDCDDHDPAVHPGAVEICNNMRDDDCANGKDCEDSTCANKECGPVVGAECAGSSCAEAVCDDGIDNDNDGPVDCADGDCAGKICKNGGTCANHSCQGAASENGLCSDGLDNDGDQLIDCADPDCLAQSCTNGNHCLTGMTCDSSHQCDGGTAVLCAPPGSCFFAGQCQPADGGCYYPPHGGAACDDGNLCTGPDQCDDAGTCAGAAVTCPALGPCLRPSGCAAATGCMYMAAPGNACDDGNPCTQGDSCLGDAGCQGVSGPCAAPACQWPVGCSLDAGCEFGALDAGIGCDAGVCNGGGACIPTFPYVPSNFTEVQVPTPRGAVVLDCGLTRVNTNDGDGGVQFDNWCGGAPAFTVISQASGPDALLISADGFDLTADGGLDISGDRPLIIVSLKGIDVIGKLHAYAGSDACASGGAGGPVASDKGAGGGGFGSAGKNGGNSGSAGGGALSTNLVPLRGGCPGGGQNGIGGLGGGAVQLSAAQNVNVVGVISAPGRKGSGGGANEGGRGGGSGGGVLLEGLTVLVGPAASILTNGGGSGQGGGNVFGGDDGHDGRDDGSPATGGAALIVGGAGGDGAAGTTDATAGHDGSVGGAGGAGGGGLGHIQLNTATICSLGGGLLSGVVSSNQPDAGCN